MLIIAIVIPVIILVYIISTRNKFASYKIKIAESLSGIDVALEKRYDTLTKSYQLVKQYMEYEESTLEKVITLRSGSIKQKQEANGILEDLKEKINLTFEQYPNLRAADTFQSLQDSVDETENYLQAARRLYNSNVSIYNQLIVNFPSNLIASSLNYIKEDFFETSAEKKKDVVFN